MEDHHLGKKLNTLFTKTLERLANDDIRVNHKVLLKKG